MYCLLFCMSFLLVFCVGCESEQRGAPSQKFKTFLGKHAFFSNPPSHSFRAVYLQKHIPNSLTVTWGKVDGVYRSFKVALLKDQPDCFPKTNDVDYDALAEKFSPYKMLEEFDWINGGNASYGFGVKEEPGGAGYLLNGAEKMPNAIVNDSCIPFSSIYDNCLMKDIEQHYAIEEVSSTNNKTYPNAVTVRTKHKTKSFTKIFYFDAKHGVCIGEQTMDPSSTKIDSQMIYRYDKTDSEWRLRGTEAYFPDENDDLQLSRIDFFLEWKLDDSLDTKTCYLRHYDYPEPVFETKQNRLWLYLTIGSVALLAVITSIVLRRKQSGS